MDTTIDAMNRASADEAASMLAGLYPAPWVAERSVTRRPFVSVAHLKRVLVEAVRSVDDATRIALIEADEADEFEADARDAEAHDRVEAHHPAGADPADPGSVHPGGGTDVADTIAALRHEHRAGFGFAAVIDTAGPRRTGMTDDEIVDALSRRLGLAPATALAESVRHLHRIAARRLDERLGRVPALGAELLDRAAELAQFSDPGWAERGELTVTYLTDAHRACSATLDAWMVDCGFDEVTVDPVGNVVGVYRADPRTGVTTTDATPAPRLLTGSHFDTVRNAGRYDGRLGILVPMLAVRELHRSGRRLPFDVELVAFAEEEGQRFPATFVGSRAVIGGFDPAWLHQVDADGVTMAAAMDAAGLRRDEIAEVARDPARYLGFVEVHIEQGPVLDDLDLPLGVVTSINGSVRTFCEIEGSASHAGTTPMDRRRDAAAAAAEVVLAVERRGSAHPELVATVGMLDVPGGSINVVPGRCTFSIDIRATTDTVRDACHDDVMAELEAVCARRGLRCHAVEALRTMAAPSAPEWQERWERVVRSLGLPVHRMPSGAGHDAMVLHEVMPQAMLFVRGMNQGISHSPLEAVDVDDADLAVAAFSALLDQLADEMR